MMKIHRLTKIIAASLFYATNAVAESFFPSPLITAEWLSVQQSEHIVILDARKYLESFLTEGHIENAVLVNNKAVRVNKEVDSKSLTLMRPTHHQFEGFMQQHGINQNSFVVITHQGKTTGQVAGAARLYWHLKTFNVREDDMLYLNHA